MESSGKYILRTLFHFLTTHNDFKIAINFKCIYSLCQYKIQNIKNYYFITLVMSRFFIRESCRVYIYNLYPRDYKIV